MKGKPRSHHKSSSASQPQQLPQKTYIEQERDVYQDYQKRKTMVRQKITELIQLNRSINEKDSKQLEFLDVIQENIYKNMITIDPTCFKELIILKNPPICFQCSVLALRILVSSNETNSLIDWEEFQQIIKHKEIEFLGLIYGFQQLTIENVFSKQNIMRAKNELLKYLIEANLSKWISDEERPSFSLKYGIQIQNLVQLAENVIGFVEVYDQVIQELNLETMKFNPNLSNQKQDQLSMIDCEDSIARAPVSSLQQSPKQYHLQKKHDQISNQLQPFAASTEKLVQKKKKQIPNQLSNKKSHSLQIKKQKLFNFQNIDQCSHSSQGKQKTELSPKNDETIVYIQQQIGSFSFEDDHQQTIQTQSTILQQKNDQIPNEVKSQQVQKQKLESQNKYSTPKRRIRQLSDQNITNISPSKVSRTKMKLMTPKQSPSKKDSSQYVQSIRGEIHSSDSNLSNLQDAILQNEQNIKNYERDQIDLTWKIEKEKIQLKRNLEKIQEHDDILKQEQWRKESISSKADKFKTDRSKKDDSQDLNRQLRINSQQKDSQSESDNQLTIDLQMNLKRFHQILRNK